MNVRQTITVVTMIADIGKIPEIRKLTLTVNGWHCDMRTKAGVIVVSRPTLVELYETVKEFLT